MSSFLNKAKDKLEQAMDKNSNKGDNPRSDNYGPHGSNVANKMDPKVDSDRDGRNDPSSRVGGYGNTQGHDNYGTTQGAGGFTSSDTYGSSGNHPGHDNPRSDNAGPHSSNMMNKMDPRVDSDRDNRNDPSSRAGGYGNTQMAGDNYGQAGGVGGLGTTDTGYGHSTGGYGDSSVGTAGGYGGSHTGHSGHSGHTGHTGHTGGLAAATGSNTGHGYGGSAGGYDDPRSQNAGPHGSNMANKLDPRVDSDRDNRNDPTSRVGGYGAQGDNYGHSTGIGGGNAGGYSSGHTGGYAAGGTEGYGSGNREGYGAGNTGGYSSGNTEGYGSGNTGGYGNSSNTPGSGNASKTAGPYNSNLLNKLDPRVDSDMDGSKTYGGNATHR